MNSAPFNPGTPGIATTPGLPPGPPNRPWYTLATILDPDTMIARWLARYGDPFCTSVISGPTVVTCSPEGARSLLTADPDSFAVADPELMLPLIGDKSVLLLSGEQHRTERKLLGPPFHGDRMRAYGALMREIALKYAAAWPLNTPLRALDTTQPISLEVILRAVFGVESDRVDAFRQVIIELVNSFGPLLIFLRALRRPLWGLGPWDRFVAKRDLLDRMLDEEMRRRAAEPKERHDILSLLMAARREDGSPLDRQHLRDELVTLLFAGHETTGLSLAWALYHLHRSPEVLAKLRAELAGSQAALTSQPDAVTQLPYLSAVCSETLRLHPLAPIVPPRLVKRPFEFLGYTLPPGTLVTVGTTRLHKREDLYPDPLAFRPERFIGRTYSPFEYMPFGGGVRRCLGAAFALYEMKIVLAAIVESCRLELASNEPVREIRRNAIMAPSNGVQLVLRERLPGAQARAAS